MRVRGAPDEAVLSDRCGVLSGCANSHPPAHRLRESVLRRADGTPLRLLTSLTDPALSATQIGELYRHRWQIELFFRWLKSCSHFRHSMSHSPSGLGAALYVALIATLLTAFVTGRGPSKVALAILQWVAAGPAKMEQMLPTLDRFERERELARLRREKLRAALRAQQ